MSDMFSPLPLKSDLLTALINQSQPVRHFTVAEKEAGETHSHLSEALDPALYQAGGLLNEQTLEPFFANPLPDAPLAAAIKTQPNPELTPSIAEPPFSPKKKKDSGEGFLNNTLVQAKTKVQRQKPQTKKQLEPKRAETEQTAATEHQSSANQIHSSKTTQTIQRKVRGLEEARQGVDSGFEQQQANAVAQFADRERKAGAKARNIGKPDAVSVRQVQQKTERKSSGGSIEKKAINRHQAVEILEKKWKSQAWNSPLKTSGKSAHDGLLPDEENQLRSCQSEMPLLDTEVQIEQKVAQILDQRSDAGERKKSLDTSVMGRSQHEKKLTPDTNRALRQASLTDVDSEQVDTGAFTPAPSTPTKPEGLVGLRGLAARAARNKTIASAPGLAQSSTLDDHAEATAQGQPPGSTVSQSSERNQTNSTRALSVSELAELIAQEAKRAGINLEQFQP